MSRNIYSTIFRTIFEYTKNHLQSSIYHHRDAEFSKSMKSYKNPLQTHKYMGHKNLQTYIAP